MSQILDKQVLNDRDALFVYPVERSGVYAEHNMIYKYSYPDTDYPILRLPYDIYDSEGEVLPHGMYMIALDSSRKYLLFIQSNSLKARVPAVNVSEVMVTDKDFEKREELAQKYQKYMNRGKQRKAKKILNELQTYDKRVRAKMSAEIEATEDGVYIIRYKTFLQKATGIIPIY